MSKNNSSNGSRPQVMRREAWLDLPDKEYPNFRMKVWANAPTKLWLQINSGSETKAQEAARQLFLEHNGWLDFDGNEYPPPSEQSFWEEIPTELAAAVFALAQVEMQKLPNSILPRRANSRRG